MDSWVKSILIESDLSVCQKQNMYSCVLASEKGLVQSKQKKKTYIWGFTNSLFAIRELKSDKVVIHEDGINLELSS